MVEVCSGLHAVAGAYDAILCDVWGVIHDGKRAFSKACDALVRFRNERGPVILITNAPVPKDRVTAVFDRVGVPHDCYDDVVTSGDATRNELALRAPGPVYPIGIPDDHSIYRGLGVELTNDPEIAEVVCCTSLRDYPNGRPETYREELQRLAIRGLELICANPDIVFRHGDKLIWSAGSIAKLYEELGGAVIRPGKPDAPIYRLANARIEALASLRPSSSRLLAIGDGPATDVRGANREGIDALFIGDGIHGAAFENETEFAAAAAAILARDNVVARYAMHALAW